MTGCNVWGWVLEAGERIIFPECLHSYFFPETFTQHTGEELVTHH